MNHPESLSSESVKQATTPRAAADQVDESVQAIETLLDELAGLSERGVARREFYQTLIERAADAMGCTAAVFWAAGPDGLMVAAFESDLQRAYAGHSPAAFQQHQQWANEVLPGTTPQLCAKQIEGMGPLLACPVRIFEEPWGVVAFYFPNQVAERASRAFIPLLSALAELLADFEKGERLRAQEGRVSELERLLSLSATLHSKTGIRPIAYELANEGREFLKADRFTVFRRGLWRDRLVSCSGLAEAESRSSTLRLISRLVTRSLNGGTPIMYGGEASAVAPQLRPCFDEYAQLVKPSFLAVVPIAENKQPGRARPTTLGAIVVECFQAFDPVVLARQLALLTPQARSAMGQADRFERIPLRWIWQGLGSLLRLLSIDRAFKTLLVVAVVVGLVLAAFIVQADFEIPVRGELRPVGERNVFAPLDGEIESVLVSHADNVMQGDILAEMRSSELDKQLNEIDGEFESTRSRMEGLQIAMSQLGGRADSEADRAQLAASIDELAEKIKTLARRRTFLVEEKQKLIIRSPIDGQVASWNVQQLLRSRPVRVGDSLLKISDGNGPWHIVCEIPDRKIGYVSQYQLQNGDSLAVNFVLATDPSRRLTGQLNRLSEVVFVNDDQEPVVRATVDFAYEQVEQKRIGAQVIGRVHCGRRSLFFVWTYEIMDALERRFF